jgi:hypothetical protein
LLQPGDRRLRASDRREQPERQNDPEDRAQPMSPKGEVAPGRPPA